LASMPSAALPRHMEGVVVAEVSVEHQGGH
jgi:hypothetical protein